MAQIYEIDADLPRTRALLKFKNQDQPVLVLTVDKLSHDFKNLQEAASLLRGANNPRASQMADWLQSSAEGVAAVISGARSGVD